MNHFYCREKELQKLNERYEDDSFECIIIHGRRWVGKTALINEFCKSKPTIFFSALNTTGQESPLYGRRTAQFKIEPLDYKETAAFHPDRPLTDNALIYGITGGIPHYINKLNVKTDIDTALLKNLFDSSAYLYEEPANLLKQELREPAIYNAIIKAVAEGSSHLNEIVTKVGETSGTCTIYLKTLIELEIIKKKRLSRKSREKRRFIFWQTIFSVSGTGSFPQIQVQSTPAGSV